MDTGKSIETPQSSWNIIKKSMKINTKLEYHTLEQLFKMTSRQQEVWPWTGSSVPALWKHTNTQTVLPWCWGDFHPVHVESVVLGLVAAVPLLTWDTFGYWTSGCMPGFLKKSCFFFPFRKWNLIRTGFLKLVFWNALPKMHVSWISMGFLHDCKS